MANINLTEPSELIKKGIVICREKRKAHPFGVFYGHNPLDYSFPLMLLELSSFIILYRVIRFLLTPLRQPKVVSQIIGGIILGPSVLGRFKKIHGYMFPDNAYYVIHNIGVMGFMYFLFLSGVKMDLMLVKKARKQHWYIALVGVLIPLFCSVAIALIERKSLDKEIAKASSILGISTCLAITAFPVLYPIIKELNLLSSEIGRTALSTAVVSDVIGVSGLLVFEVSKQGEHKAISSLWYMISLVIIMVSVIGGVKHATMWIVRTTPEGKPVGQIYVISILLGVMVIGFISDMFGMTIVNGPLWLGLAVPDGPPLGAILVEKSETIMGEILMPFSFMYVGSMVDVSSMSSNWSRLQPLFIMILVGYLVKMVSTLVVSHFLDVSIRDSLTLSLLMSLRGEMEILLFLHLKDFEIIGQSHFTVMVLLTVSVTALFTPLISLLYDPTRPYMVHKRRNIQHTPPNTELNVVACIYGEESVYGLMKLLQVTNPTINAPLSVNALFLVELVGRANPVFIDHQNEEEEGSHHSKFNKIHNALKIFQDTIGECININFYTTITAKKSMYQDICQLALSKKSNLIILPLHKKTLNRTRSTKKGCQSINSNVLAHAPCSVGILLDNSSYQNLVNGVLRSPMHNLALLFFGGSDAREALAYVDRMVTNQSTLLTVVRFLSHENEGDNEIEKKLDDGMVTSFWVKSERNDRITYREVVVKNGEEAIAAIQAMHDKERYDLWIVGRKHGINPVLLEGLSTWSYSNELGVIGDYISSVDFGIRASVLAVQQQILIGQEKAETSMLKRFSFCI